MDRPILGIFRRVAVAHADYSVDKSEDRLERLTDRLRAIRSDFMSDVQALSPSRDITRQAVDMFDDFAETVCAIVARNMDIRPQVVAVEAERVARMIEQMLETETERGTNCKLFAKQ